MRHRRTVAVAWLVIGVAAVTVSSAVAADTKIKQDAPGEAGRAAALIDQRFGNREESAREVVVFSHPRLSVDDPEYRNTVARLMGDLRALRVTSIDVAGTTTVTTSKRVVSTTLTTYDTGLPSARSPFVAHRAHGGDVTFAIVNLVGAERDAEKTVGSVVDTVARASGKDGFTIDVGGGASIAKGSNDVVEKDFAFALRLNLPVTLVLLLLAFGALVAALVPIALALTAIVIASGILALVSRAYALDQIYSEMVLLMGLATGIDYSLFVITRYRTERGRGRMRDDAILAACATSGKAVLFAGVTVLLAISGMFLVGNVVFTSLALSAIVVVALAVIISITLLPALLSMLGDRIDRGRLPFLGRREHRHGGFWGVVSDYVLARPLIVTVATLVVLLALAAPIVTFNLGFNGNKALPNAVKAKQALLTLQNNFTLGLTSPAVVVVDAGKNHNIFAPELRSATDKLLGSVRAETASATNHGAPYGSPVQVEVNDGGDTSVVRVPINADTGDDKAIHAVEHLRHDLVPAAFSNASARVLVTGETAANIDFRRHIEQKTPIVFAYVVGLTFLILLVAFRSIVIPIKAIILNTLSVAASYGILVLVFQKGILLEGILNFNATGIIESWLPLFLFSILFGLSMDYHMFVMSRIKEAHESGANTDDAISSGIKATAGTITSAAAIMVAVALIFAFTRLIGLKQFGFGLATAIFIDATIIRSVLLPTSMKLLGDRNWYLPSWLGWLPNIRMDEGAGVHDAMSKEPASTVGAR